MLIALIARTAGQSLASEVAQHLLLLSRSGIERQNKFSLDDHRSSREDIVGQARKIMETTIEEPKSCTTIADMVGVSERHLQRLFHQQFGSSMLEIYQALRMERAHQLVQLTDLSITEISVACGFSSLETFSRTYRRAFGVAPSRDRSQSLDSSVFRLGQARSQIR